MKAYRNGLISKGEIWRNSVFASFMFFVVASNQNTCPPDASMRRLSIHHFPFA